MKIIIVTNQGSFNSLAIGLEITLSLGFFFLLLVMYIIFTLVMYRSLYKGKED